jgi:hypothetical protein
VSEWFDEYMAKEEAEPGQVPIDPTISCPFSSKLSMVQEPELHKAMTLLLARCWEYKLKTEDVLELTQGNRRIALCTIVGLLEDGHKCGGEVRQSCRYKMLQG